MHVEQRLKFGRRKCRAYLGVRLQKLQERTLAAEGAHGTLLHEAIGVLAGEAFLRERQQHLLGVNQAAAAFQILQHSLRVHHELIDHPGQPRQREVERDGGVRPDHALHRGMRDVALVPKRHVLHGRHRVAAHDPGQGR